MAVNSAKNMNSEAEPGLVKAVGTPSAPTTLTDASKQNNLISQHTKASQLLRDNYTKSLKKLSGRRKLIQDTYNKSSANIKYDPSGEQAIRERYISRGLGSSGALYDALNQYKNTFENQKTNAVTNRDAELAKLLREEKSVKDKYKKDSKASQSTLSSMIRKLQPNIPGRPRV